LERGPITKIKYIITIKKKKIGPKEGPGSFGPPFGSSPVSVSRN